MASGDDFGTRFGDSSDGDWDDDGECYREDIPVVLPLFSPPAAPSSSEDPPASADAAGGALNASEAQQQPEASAAAPTAAEGDEDQEEEVQASWWLEDGGADADRRARLDAAEDLAAEADYLLPSGELFGGAAAAAIFAAHAAGSEAADEQQQGGDGEEAAGLPPPPGHGPLSAPPSVFARLLAACDALSRTEADLRAAEEMLPRVSAALDVADERVDGVSSALSAESWAAAVAKAAEQQAPPSAAPSGAAAASKQPAQQESADEPSSSSSSTCATGGEEHPQAPLVRALSLWTAGAVRAAARHAMEALGWLASAESSEQRASGDPDPLMRELEDRFRGSSGSGNQGGGAAGGGGAQQQQPPPAGGGDSSSSSPKPGEGQGKQPPPQGPSVPRPGAAGPEGIGSYLSPPPGGMFPPLGSSPPFGPGMMGGPGIGWGAPSAASPSSSSGRGASSAGGRRRGGFFPEQPSPDQTDAVILAFCRRETRWLSERAQRHLRVVLPRLRRTMRRQEEEVLSLRTKKARLAATVDNLLAVAAKSPESRTAGDLLAATTTAHPSRIAVDKTCAAGSPAMAAWLQQLRSAVSAACLALEHATDAVDEQLRVLDAACRSCERSSRSALVALDAAAPLFRRWEENERLHHAIDLAAASARRKLEDSPPHASAFQASQFSLEALLEFAFTEAAAEMDPLYMRVLEKAPGTTHEETHSALRSLVGRSRSGRIIFVQEMLSVPPPTEPKNNLRSILRDGQEQPLGRGAFDSDLEWAVFQALCAEAGVRPAMSLHELMPAAGMFVERAA